MSANQYATIRDVKYVEAMTRVVVVSAHLDDGVFSLGASINAAARAGADVTVLTVLAGNPTSDEQAGAWDRAAGFQASGHASASRRAEDARACAIVGAKASWLPFGDNQYARGGSDPEIRARVAEEVSGADLVLIPGLPLEHEDHLWLAHLLRGDLGARAVGEYVEQPYAALSGVRPRGDCGWEGLSLPYISIGAKHRAIGAYESQIPLLPVDSFATVRIAEARSRGETIRLRSGSRDAFDEVMGLLWPGRARVVQVLAGRASS